MNKVTALFQRFLGGIKDFPLNYKEFGFYVSFLLVLGKTYPPLKGKKYISSIYKYIEHEMVPYFQQWTKDFIKNTSVQMDFFPLWFCWFQGEDHLGPMCKICLYQLKKNAPKGSKVIVLDYNNIPNYVDIPDYIWKKHNDSLITKAQFSDILRFSLLAKYGGLWVDSTIYTTRKIDDSIVNKPFFSCKLHKNICTKEPCQGLWTGFLIGGKVSIPIFYLVKQCLYKYWEIHDRLIDYVSVDYFLMCVYNHAEELRKIIDSITFDNSQIWELWESINKEYTEQLYSHLMNAQTFYKTSHHVIADEYVDGKQTVWGKIVEDYKSNTNTK